ncbi:MAG: hypothetical protein P8J50_17745 [Acidimicrobiales bacterium]|jgi:hypothetical protein|nr:hypothetical protein [Acidimicrobiales bacterium]
MVKSARLLMLAAVIATTVVLGSASPALACSCAGPVSDSEALSTNDAAFEGTVVELHDARTGALSTDHPDVIVLDVTAVYAGEVGNQVGVVTSPSGASCGYDFAVGVEYLVFGRAESGFHTLEDGWYDVGLCSGTRRLSAEPVGIEGEPSPPLDTGDISDGAIQRHLGSVRPSLFPEAFIFIGVFAFVIGLVAWLNRKGRTVA